MQKTRLKSKIAVALFRHGKRAQGCIYIPHSAIAHQVTLATPDPAERLCLFTDASSTHWAGVLTQVDPAAIARYTLLPLEWNHSTLASYLGSFRGPSSRWTTPEQEIYATVAGVALLSHLLAECGQLSMFTDHKNILYMLSPTCFNANVARQIVNKT